MDQNGVIYLYNNFIDFTIFRRDGNYYNEQSKAKPKILNIDKQYKKQSSIYLWEVNNEIYTNFRIGKEETLENQF